MLHKNLSRMLICVFLAMPSAFTRAGTTGKIAGKVTDKNTGEALIGANIAIEGTTLGGVADVHGNFVILNVPPGIFKINASMLGYRNFTVSHVRVEIDRTVRLDLALEQEALLGEEVTITAERPVVQEDVSTSVAAISKEEVEALPLTNVNQVVGLQAGVEAGLVIRGGSADEALFLVDGATLRDPRTNQPISGIPLSAVQEISIERGGFNAEYGQVRSGIVNVVTKEGGRSGYSGTITMKYSPPSPKYFGISPYDPNSMWLRPYLDPAVALTGTQNGAWDAYTQRQYPTFDGWNAISQQLLSDDDPSNDLSPAGAQRLFEWQHRKREVTDQPDYNLDAGLGGPVPFIGKSLGDLRFFASYRNNREMLLVPLTREDYYDYDGSLRLTSDITPTMKLNLGGTLGKSHNIAVNGSEQISSTDYIRTPFQIADQVDLFPFTTSARVFSDSYYSLAEVKHYSAAAKLTHVLNSRTFYEASIEHVSRKYATAPTALRDTTKSYEIVPGYFADEAPFGWSPLPQTGIGDGMLFGGHTSTARDASKISSTAFKFDLTSQVGFTHQFKTGLEVVYNDLNVDYGTVNLVFPESNNYASWHETPLRAALYVQDKIETKGFIANLGLRLDYNDPSTQWIDVDPFDKSFYSSRYDPATPFSTQPARSELLFSPRLGISHPITVNSKLFFNYGHFNQLPTYEQIFRLSRGAFSQVLNIGDPNLALARTVSYELGYDHALFNAYLIQLAAFYHDIVEQQDVATYISADASIRYERANNNSYEDIRGFELTLRKTTGRWWNGFANYTYRVTSSGRFGTGEVYEDPSQQRDYDLRTDEQYQSRPVPQPYARANLNFFTPANYGPEVLGGNLLGNWNLNVLADWRAGAFAVHPDDITNVARLEMKDWFNIVLRLSKTFSYGNSRLAFLMDVNNLLNTQRLSLASFYDANDQRDYYNSLQLPQSTYYDNIPGKDKVGDYRKEGVAFQPIEPVGNVGNVTDPNANVIYYDKSTGQYMNFANGSWSQVESGRMNQVLEDKAYIDMPNQTSFNFLSPRDVFIGLRLSFDFE